jgi:hypothetical protein
MQIGCLGINVCLLVHFVSKRYFKRYPKKNIHKHFCSCPTGTPLESPNALDRVGHVAAPLATTELTCISQAWHVFSQKPG